jgi:formiminotetrahydrofolate cyclodeaminase
MSEKSNLLDSSVREFAAAAAAKTPTPGGGSVAGVVGALATALGEMALNFTRGKKKYAEHQAVHDQLAARLEKARGLFLDLVADDMSAYGMYAEASRQDDGAAKDQAMQLALAASINVPREMAKLALAVLGDLRELTDKCNPWLLSDLVAAAILASAVTGLCDLNVRVNAKNLDDTQAADDVRTAAAIDRTTAAELAANIEECVKENLGP